MVDFSTRLASAMKHAGVDAPGLAKLMGVKRQAVEKVFRGESNSFSAPNAFKAADACGVSARWLVLGDGQMIESDAGSPPPVQLRQPRQAVVTEPQALFAGIARLCEPLDRAGRKMVAAALEEAAINPDSASVQADRVAGILMPAPGKERAA